MYYLRIDILPFDYAFVLNAPQFPIFSEKTTITLKHGRSRVANAENAVSSVSTKRW